MTSRRLFLWALLSALLLSSHAGVAAQSTNELEEVAPSQQRRQLWDFFSFASLMMHVGPPCSRKDGSKDWGPFDGPRWRDCSKEESAYSSDSSMQSSSQAQVNEYNANDASENAYNDQGAASGNGFGAVSGVQLWMFVVAGSILSALVAINMGQRKPSENQARHGMAGSVMRRVGAVSAFAAGALPGRKQNKAVEMQPHRAEYRLDMGDPSVPSTTV